MEKKKEKKRNVRKGLNKMLRSMLLLLLLFKALENPEKVHGKKKRERDGEKQNSIPRH